MGTTLLFVDVTVIPETKAAVEILHHVAGYARHDGGFRARFLRIYYSACLDWKLFGAARRWALRLP